MRFLLTLLLSFGFVAGLSAQELYFDGHFRKKSYMNNNHRYVLFDFKIGDGRVKTKFFAQNAYARYQEWKKNREVLLVTVGAFSDSWEMDARPVGMCIDEGTVVSRVADPRMDGIVLMYPTGETTIADLGARSVYIRTDAGKEVLSPRESSVDRVRLLDWAEKNRVTLFQTQLLFSSFRPAAKPDLNYGEKRERRFLALCTKGGSEHQVVVDAPSDLTLNLSAAYAKEILEHDGFRVSFLLNMETGGRNILHAYNGAYLQDLQPNASNAEARIERSTNLLVFYID
ncbi:hypothetical protein [Flaviaesturariibacter amylovorans]|uniref:Phosphodiester glycosidase domain-containing protein n=1 Tax=Flaviaesturariibacter amylovorans TaxID=1084520 RepID=A0ABP8G7A6_9BACT